MKIKLKREKGSGLRIFANGREYRIIELANLSNELTETTSNLLGVFNGYAGKETPIWNKRQTFECPTFYFKDFSKRIEIELIDYNNDSLSEIKQKIKNNVSKVKDWIDSLPKADLLEFEI